MPNEPRPAVGSLERAGNHPRAAESHHRVGERVRSVRDVSEVTLQLAAEFLALPRIRDPRLAHDAIDEGGQVLAGTHGRHRGSHASRRKSIPTACAWSRPAAALWR